MGKLLIIKNADFHANAVSETGQWRNLEKAGSMTGWYINDATGVMSQNNLQTGNYYVVSQGDIIRIRYDVAGDIYFRYGIVSNNPNEDKQQTASQYASVRTIETDEITVTSSGYLLVTAYGNTDSVRNAITVKKKA